MPVEEDAWIKPHDSADEDNYSQAGDLFRIMSHDQQEQLAANIAEGLGQASADIQKRMLEHFKLADPDYEQAVRKALSQ